MTAPIKWSEATSPILWSNIGIDWDSPAKANTSTYASSVGYTASNNATQNVSATLGSNMGKIHASTLATSGVVSFGNVVGTSSEGGFTFTGVIEFSNSLGYTPVDVHTAVGSATFALDNTYITNTNHAESVSVGVTCADGSSSGLLWNEVSDPTTVWTRVEYPN
jgi:hypothetical protein